MWALLCTQSGVTSPDVPGLLPVVSSPVPSSFRARRNSLLRSGPRRISFSLDGAMSMGGVVLEGCCRCDGTQGKIREQHQDTGQHYSKCVCKLPNYWSKNSFPLCLHLFWGVVLWCADWGARLGCRDGAGKDWIPAWHVKTWLCDLSTTGFPLSALRGKKSTCVQSSGMFTVYTQTQVVSLHRQSSCQHKNDQSITCARSREKVHVLKSFKKNNMAHQNIMICNRFCGN